jgi:hypothetical protein
MIHEFADFLRSSGSAIQNWADSVRSWFSAFLSSQLCSDLSVIGEFLLLFLLVVTVLLFIGLMIWAIVTPYSEDE